MGVGEATANTLALVLHELATNSLKYGALSSSTGTLDMSCTELDDDIVMVWTERGGRLWGLPLAREDSAQKWWRGFWPVISAVRLIAHGLPRA